jgi:hypothetical protein
VEVSIRFFVESTFEDVEIGLDFDEILFGVDVLGE